ncbi:MAG: acetylornithine deacetylase [Porticoccaceae bacterium]|nr:acetylornithine deacetylase [Porticoccaceae bacterium]
MTIQQMLKALIGTNSISSIIPDIDHGNRDVIELLAVWLADLGFRVEIMPLADPRKANLIATLGSGPGGLVLAGHTDTVPCNESLWQSSPFALTERDNRFYGLGTSDMKGFFALVVEAVRACRGQAMKQPLIVLATADEESSMAGAKALAAAGKPRARYAVIGEPTGLKPIRSHKGIMIEKLVIAGRSGHSSNPALGNNAMHSLNRVLTELMAIREELKNTYQNPLFAVDYPTLNLGCVHGGDNFNRICGNCELGFEIRPLPGMDMAELQSLLERRLLPLGEPDGTPIELSHYAVPAFSAPDNSDLVRECEKLTGHGAEAVAFATEAAYLTELGMDVVVMGPGDIDQAHQPDEYLGLERINPMVDTLKRLIGRYCIAPDPVPVAPRAQ